MSFLEQLQKSRHSLQPTETTVTYMDGSRKVFRGEMERDIPKRLGFIIDNSPDQVPACVLSQFLYLGSQDCVRREVFEKYEISHVLSVGIETPPFEGFLQVRCKFIECLDLPETDLAVVIKQSSEFIEGCRRDGGRVLVHCNAGVSRSTSVVIGYLMKHHDYSFLQALGLVKSKRPCVQPNVGFINQLKKLQ
uniref:Dual specificity protein phosphatase 19 n=1 Tax=Culex pipiens TaxID=7175 RepID=A0A8D8H387_CULPI